MNVSSNFSTDNPNSHCTVFNIQELPYSIFKYRTKKFLTSLAINSKTTLLSKESIFIYNNQTPGKY